MKELIESDKNTEEIVNELTERSASYDASKLKKELMKLKFEDPTEGDVSPSDRDVNIDSDGFLRLSAEGENSYLWADYYGEFRGGHPWISDKLENWADKKGYYWDWMNPGELILSD